MHGILVAELTGFEGRLENGEEALGEEREAKRGRKPSHTEALKSVSAWGSGVLTQCVALGFCRDGESCSGQGCEWPEPGPAWMP